jgi:hypothetical protein
LAHPCVPPPLFPSIHRSDVRCTSELCTYLYYHVVMRECECIEWQQLHVNLQTPRYGHDILIISLFLSLSLDCEQISHLLLLSLSLSLSLSHSLSLCLTLSDAPRPTTAALARYSRWRRERRRRMKEQRRWWYQRLRSSLPRWLQVYICAFASSLGTKAVVGS